MSEHETRVERTFTNKEIFEFILDADRDPMDVVIDTEWSVSINKRFQQSLFPNRCLFDTVIDMAGIHATISRPGFLYLPTSIRVFDVVELINRTKAYNKLKEISVFDYVDVKVPRQSNGCDCGNFVIKWVEALMDESLWTNKDYFKNLNQFRKNMAIKLKRWEKNKIKEFA